MSDNWTSRIPRFAFEYRPWRSDTGSVTQAGGEESLPAAPSQV